MPKPTIFSHRFLTLRQYGSLFCDITQVPDNLLITIVKSIYSIRYPHLLAVLNHELLRGTKIVSRDARKEMVDGLPGSAKYNTVSKSLT